MCPRVLDHSASPAGADGPYPSSAGTHVASIMHVTDTHLFVDEEGVTRPSGQRSTLVKVLARLGVQDLEFAADDVVARLPDLLVRAVAAERDALGDGAPVVIAHTGDAEAFGASGRIGRFTGFAHLTSLFDAAGPDDVVTVYGNHDVWPGSVALLGLNGPRHDAQKRSIHHHAGMIGALPPEQALRFPTAHGMAITFVPLNSVHSGAVRGGLLANGRLSSHPPDTGDIMDRLRTVTLRDTDLNIAVLHHPPHAARPITVRDRLGVGRLENGRSVAAELRRMGINLVLSGHHHRLDPPFGHGLDASTGRQPPLPASMAQLVALSPTMDSHRGAADHGVRGAPRRGLCVYRIILGSSRSSVTVQRLIYPTDLVGGPTFEPTVISGIRLGVTDGG